MSDDLNPRSGTDHLNYGEHQRTKADCIAAAGRALAVALEHMADMTSRQQAEAAHRAGGPSVDKLEQRIRDQRRQRWKHRTGRPGPQTRLCPPAETRRARRRFLTTHDGP